MNVEFNGRTYDCSHGTPFDRGAIDSCYHRAAKPHYYVHTTKPSVLVQESEMSERELEEYYAGYEYNELFGEKKEFY